MSGFQMPITINQAMQYIENNYYVLPAFQRDFVWSGSIYGQVVLRKIRPLLGGKLYYDGSSYHQHGQ